MYLILDVLVNRLALLNYVDNVCFWVLIFITIIRNLTLHPNRNFNSMLLMLKYAEEKDEQGQHYIWISPEPFYIFNL